MMYEYEDETNKKPSKLPLIIAVILFILFFVAVYYDY